jgi:hypothetical protein
VEAVDVTLNETEVRKYGTETDVGNVKPRPVFPIPIGTPVIGAIEVIVAVHVAVAPGAIVAGLQVKVLSDCAVATLETAARISPSFTRPLLVIVKESSRCEFGHTSSSPSGGEVRKFIQPQTVRLLTEWASISGTSGTRQHSF